MYRAFLPRLLAVIFTTCSLVGAVLIPLVVQAQVCPEKHPECTAAQTQASGYCQCIVNEYIIHGFCGKVEECHGVNVTAPDGTMLKITQTPQGVQDILAGKDTGILGWIKDNPLISGLGLGLGTSLLQSLMSPSSNNSSSDTGQTQTGTCTTQYYYTSDTSQLNNPCALYDPNGATNQTQTNNTTDNGVSDLLKNLQNQNPNITLNVPTTTNIFGNPANCPLITQAIPNCQQGFTLQDGGFDNNGCTLAPTCVLAPSNQLSTTSPIVLSTTPTPTSTAAVNPFQVPDLTATDTTGTGIIDTGTQPVPVADILASGQNYTNVTNVNTPTPDQTPLNQKNLPLPANGLHGDLLSFGGGVTIYANSRTSGTEVSGFFGSNSTAAKLCQSRPWANNFLSYIIPPSFFDNLCAAAGYPPGTIQTIGAGTGAPQNVSVSGPSTATPVYDNGVHSSAKIWARPASVSLGGRTTIFWTSQNVTSCTESSSDGNFSGSSTSGGASTVALSGAVTFTIKCNTVDGKTISDSTTVGIGI